MRFSFPPLLGSKKTGTRSVSRSDQPSFGSGTLSDSSVYLQQNPKSVLPSSKPGQIWGTQWPHFSTNHLKWDIVEVFKLLDKDGDGKISRHELELVFHRLGVEPPSPEEVGLMLEEADHDGDGCISLEEFGALSSSLGPARDHELREAFEYFNSDGDGKISAEELLGVFSTLGDEGCTLDDCRRMVDGVDKEGKGFVCYEDFARMMEGRSE